jgi:DNA-binding NarL/FixJ family response regulator
VPESAGKSSRRKAAARAADRRREAVRALRIGECTCRYAASQLANGIGPAEAQDLVLEMAGELTAVVAIMRRAAWLSTAERRALAVQLRGLGLPTKQIADQVGVSPRSVRNYLAGRPGNSLAGRPGNSPAGRPGNS